MLFASGFDRITTVIDDPAGNGRLAFEKPIVRQAGFFNFKKQKNIKK